MTRGVSGTPGFLDVDMLQVNGGSAGKVTVPERIRVQLKDGIGQSAE
jgi:hypothetical protein